MSKITRPLVRYHGGKFILAEWIISFFPEHRIYTEAFGGGASVLLKKPRCYAEIYNDMDGDIVNLFKVCRRHSKRFVNEILLTPFSREEFENSYELSEDEIERARRTVIRSFMGFGSDSISNKITGFRASSNRSGSTPAHDWEKYPYALKAVIERLRGVVIENKEAIRVLKQQDSSSTLHYIDPPYVKSTRYKGDNAKSYRFEMSDFDHEQLLDVVLKLKGCVVISGYENEIYSKLLYGFKKVNRAAFADGASKRTETLYLSPNIPIKQLQLF
jgi:DNA adenine methylase